MGVKTHAVETDFYFYHLPSWTPPYHQNPIVFDTVHSIFDVRHMHWQNFSLYDSWTLAEMLQLEMKFRRLYYLKILISYWYVVLKLGYT